MAKDNVLDEQSPETAQMMFEPETPMQMFPGLYGARTPEFLGPDQNVQVDEKLQKKREEIERMTGEDVKNHVLPLARVKKIMKSDEEVRMISAETPALLSQACEMLIIELSLRSWYFATSNNRRTLQRIDVSAAVAHTDTFDFLIDIVPREYNRK